MALPNDETVRINIVIEAQQGLNAINNLSKEMNKLVVSASTIKNILEKTAAASGKSFAEVGQRLKAVYAAEIDASKTSVQLGNNLKSAFNQQVNQQVQKLEGGLKNSTQAGQGFKQVLKLIRGTLVAIAVFRAFQFIEDSIRKAIETAKEFEQSLYRLSNVERILSKQGVEITTEGLRKGIQEIKDLLPIFSENDITQQVSLIGIMTKELGYTEQQIIDLAKAIGVLNIRSAEQESLAETTNKILTALVAPTGKGTAGLGISFGTAALEEEIVKEIEEGLLGAGKALDNLTKKEKDMVKLNIVLRNAGEELLNIQDYLDSNVAKLDEASAAWEDLLKAGGQAGLPFIPVLTSLFEVLLPLINEVRKSLFGTVVIIGIVSVFFRNFASLVIESLKTIGSAIRALARGDFKELERVIRDGISNARDRMEAFSDIIRVGTAGESIQKLAKRFFPELITAEDTATDSAGNLVDALTDITEVEGFDDLAEDLEKLQEKITETIEDFKREWDGADIDINAAINLDTTSSEFDALGREVQDFVIDVQRMVEDYAIKRERLIEDANQKIADKNRDYHNREIDEEARFQEQLRQLREKFLFNLEDALRERDARQVLRLQRQYQMDKTALINEQALKQEEQARQHQEDIARIKRERDDRLAELAEEERIKLQREKEDFELKQQRAEQDHQRELEQLNQQITDRLNLFAEQLGEEYDLNAEAVDQLKELLNAYYGPGGEFDQLYDYSYESLVANAQQMLGIINQLRAAQATMASMSALPAFNPGAISSSAFTGANMSSIGSQAQGGTYFANRPTHAVFGDVPGGEIASFLPINKLKAGMGKGSPSAGGGMGGTIELEMLLSPDLEARVVRNSMQGVSDVITKVRRTKS